MNKRAFTLLEMLVSCAILVLVFIPLAQLVWWMSGIWSGGNVRKEHRQTARYVQDFISSELRAAALPIHQQVSSSRGDLQLLINPPLAENGESSGDDFQNADTLFWQAPLTNDPTREPMVELGYFVRWRDSRAMLCRLSLTPEQSRSLFGGSDRLQRVYQHPGNWVNRAVLDAAAPADGASGFRGLFADNVIAFWARPFGKDGSVIFNTDDQIGFNSNRSSGGQSGPALPASIEISFIVIDSRAAERLAHHSDALSLIARLRTEARTARNADPFSDPATVYLEALRSLPEFHFLVEGATPHQMVVNLH